MDDVALLAEIEDTLRSMPPRASIRHETPENYAWIARVVAAIALWNPALGVQARIYRDQFHDVMAAPSQKGYVGLISLLHEAHSTLRMKTIGPATVAVGQGLIFDYFDEIRKVTAEATTDMFFVDPYLDSDFVSRYLPHVTEGVTVRLLGRERMNALMPAASLFAQQNGANIEVRSASGFHDRYVFIDRLRCFQSGASFKDGGRQPTTITQITDAFSAVLQTYEDLWKNATKKFP